MAAVDVAEQSIGAIGGRFRSGEITSRWLTEDMIARITALNPQLNAVCTTTFERARADAQRATEELALGRDRGPLHGIPITLKDNLDTAGIRTTAGSAYFKDRIPSEDATVAARLRDAGTVLLGKVNMHELAYGVTTINPLFGQTRNPWDLERIPGGSSGGSAAAVAAGLGLASVGTDTGGSVRVPAAMCGLVGIKPTYGRVSNAGLMADGASYACVGPLARTVEDCARMLQAMAGYDARDFASVRLAVDDYVGPLGDGVRGLRVGLLLGPLFDCPDDEVCAAAQAATGVLSGLGADVRDVLVPGLEALDIPLMVDMAELYRHALAERPEAFSPRVLLGLTWHPGRMTLLDYLGARRKTWRAKEVLQTALEEVDLLVAPTTPFPALPVGTELVRWGDEEIPVSRAMVRFTSTFNLTHLPAISVPCGFTAAGLPIGMQMIGRPFDEALLLRAAHAYEQATDWHLRVPPLCRNAEVAS